MYTELEEQRELATNRMMELEKLQKDHQEALREVERLKMDVSIIYWLTFLYNFRGFTGSIY